MTLSWYAFLIEPEAKAEKTKVVKITRLDVDRSCGAASRRGYCPWARPVPRAMGNPKPFILWFRPKAVRRHLNVFPEFIFQLIMADLNGGAFRQRLSLGSCVMTFIAWVANSSWPPASCWKTWIASSRQRISWRSKPVSNTPLCQESCRLPWTGFVCYQGGGEGTKAQRPPPWGKILYG